MLCRGVLVVSVKQGADADADAGASSSAHLPHAVAIVFNPALVCSASCIYLPPSCRALFATHHHGLCSEPQLAALVQMGHMQSAVQPGRGLLPSYRLAAGPAPNGSCGIQVAAACGLPPSLLDRAAEVAQRAEQVGQPSGRTGGGSPEGRQPLQQLNTLQASQSPPAAKRRRLPPQPAAEEEQQEALAAVRAVLHAALQGEPGAGRQLVRLQAQVAAALEDGEL